MVDCVQPAVVAAIAGVVEQLAARRRLRIGGDVVILEIIGSGAERQVLDRIGLLAQHPPDLGRSTGAPSNLVAGRSAVKDSRGAQSQAAGFRSPRTVGISSENVGCVG